MRTLIHVAIAHSLADFGSLTEQVKQNFQRQFGSQKWNKHLDDVEQFWNQVHNEILRLNLNWPRVRLYQDGLPVCGRELEIVSQVAASGSKNHQLLLELVHRGAHLMGRACYFLFYNEERIHAALDYRTPRVVYHEAA